MPHAVRYARCACTVWPLVIGNPYGRCGRCGELPDTPATEADYEAAREEWEVRTS